MLGNYNKLTSTLEIASLTSAQSGVPLERTRLMTALIKCLQMFENGNLAQEPALWFEARRTVDGTHRGLGLERTLPAYGFGWFLPVVD